MTRIDPNLIDFRRDGRVETLDFAAPVSDASEANSALVRLAKLARRKP